MKMKIILLLAIAIGAALVTQPVRAIAIQQTLVITENSSTSLTWTLTTSSGTTSMTVTNSAAGADHWIIALTGVSFPATPNQSWTEPGLAGFLNVVSAPLPFQPDQVTVVSDFSSVSPGMANGATDMTDFLLNGGSLWVTFNDRGDTATVPDTGSTFGLLSLSVVALLGATRLRFLQLAA